jgi:hypothetical protein
MTREQALEQAEAYARAMRDRLRSAFVPGSGCGHSR